MFLVFPTNLSILHLLFHIHTHPFITPTNLQFTPLFHGDIRPPSSIKTHTITSFQSPIPTYYWFFCTSPSPKTLQDHQFHSSMALVKFGPLHLKPHSHPSPYYVLPHLHFMLAPKKTNFIIKFINTSLNTWICQFNP